MTRWWQESHCLANGNLCFLEKASFRCISKLNQSFIINNFFQVCYAAPFSGISEKNVDVTLVYLTKRLCDIKILAGKLKLSVSCTCNSLLFIMSELQAVITSSCGSGTLFFDLLSLPSYTSPCVHGCHD